MPVTENPRGFFNGIFNTEKISPSYGYFQSYVTIAAELGPAARVCELGVETGESLRMWQALFPAGTVTGVDCDPGCTWPPGTIQVVSRQDDPELPGRIGPCDLIIDDASHEGATTRAAFDLLWPVITPGGYYVIEDWMVAIRPEFSGFGPSMLRMAEGLLPLLDDAGGSLESVTYRYGLIIVKKRRRDDRLQPG